MSGPAFKDYGLCSAKNYLSGTCRWGHGKAFLPIRVNRLDGIGSSAKKAVNFFLFEDIF
jgi:hypothetical protein